jgi:hypothetical protein
MIALKIKGFGVEIEEERKNKKNRLSAPNHRSFGYTRHPSIK